MTKVSKLKKHLSPYIMTTITVLQSCPVIFSTLASESCSGLKASTYCEQNLVGGKQIYH